MTLSPEPISFNNSPTNKSPNSGAYLRISGLKFSNVSESTLINVAVTRTINGEIRFGNDEVPPDLNDVRSASGIFFTGCNDIYANELHAYDNDYTGIIIHNSTEITIDGSETFDNGGSGIGSRNADNCNFYNIVSYNNGDTEYDDLPHFSNVSINGDCCVISNVTTSGATGSGLNIGHAKSDASRANSTIANDVKSFNNILEGVTIRGADYVQLTNSNIYENLRHNIWIADEEDDNGTIWTTNYARITDSDIHGYYNPVAQDCFIYDNYWWSNKTYRFRFIHH